MTGAGGQLAARRLPGNDNTEFPPYPLAQIDQTPAHHAMDRRSRAALCPGSPLADGAASNTSSMIAQSRRVAHATQSHALGALARLRLEHQWTE